VVRVRVLLFAGPRELLGAPSVELALPAPARARDVRAALLAAGPPRLRALLPHCLLAVNEVVVDDDCAVRATDEVALIPPVSGG